MFGFLCLQFIVLRNFNVGLHFFSAQDTEAINSTGPWNRCKTDDGAHMKQIWVRMILLELMSSAQVRGTRGERPFKGLRWFGHQRAYSLAWSQDTYDREGDTFKTHKRLDQI